MKIISNQHRRNAFLRIEKAISQHGFFMYFLNSELQLPRYLYTIGLSKTLGAELIVGGLAFLHEQEFIGISNAICNSNLLLTMPDNEIFELNGHKNLMFAPVHSTWSTKFASGTFDYFASKEIKFKQLLLVGESATCDTPNMNSNLLLQDLGPWNLDVKTLAYPESAWAAVDIAILRGAKAVEVARWDENEWQISSCPAEYISSDLVRKVPLSVVMAADPSLKVILDLAVDQIMVRDANKKTWGF